MATVERREQKRGGKIYESKRWYVRYKDMQGKRRRVAAFADKRASERLARHIEDLAACRATGAAPSTRLTEVLARLEERILNHLIKSGLLDSSQTAAARSLRGHMEAWARHLDAKRNLRCNVFGVCRGANYPVIHPAACDLRAQIPYFSLPDGRQGVH